MSEQAVGTARHNRRAAKLAASLTVLATLGVLLACSLGSIRGPQVIVGRTWPAIEQLSIDQVDHRDWDRLLRRYVDEEGNVDYAGWKETRADVRALNAYLEALSRANPAIHADRDARLAFWINAYNALTIRGILFTYPVADVPSTTGQRGLDLWNDLLLRVGGRNYSLGQIEHETLRPLREPRIHFAIVCASRGCPRLLNRAYDSSQLEDQLVDNSRRFFADPRKLSYDSATGQLRLSPILKWYAEDFGSSPDDMLKTIKPYLPEPVSRQSPGGIRLRTDFLDYDSSLNEQNRPFVPLLPPADAVGGGDHVPEEPER